MFDLREKNTKNDFDSKIDRRVKDIFDFDSKIASVRPGLPIQTDIEESFDLTMIFDLKVQCVSFNKKDSPWTSSQHFQYDRLFFCLPQSGIFSEARSFPFTLL